MRLGIALHLALTGTACAFVHYHRLASILVRKRLLSSSSLRVGQGWDNENFLDSLSGGSDAIDAANQKYQTQSEQRGKLQEWRQQQQERDTSASTLQASSEGAAEEAEDEEGQGGSRFKEMMEKSQQRAASSSEEGGEAPSGPILYNPLEGIKTPDADKAPDAAETDLSMQEQAQLFQKFMKMQQEGGSAQPQPSKSSDGRKVGRNRDADTIANTADVYFAQLKRDSTVRTIARHQGDLEKANSVFEDEGVKELEGFIQKNPYLKEQGSKASKLLETTADEMIAVMKLTAGNPEDEVRTEKGPSYKEKLAEKRKKKQGVAAPEPPKAQTTVTETVVPPPAVAGPESVSEAKAASIPKQEPFAAAVAPEQTAVMAPPPDAPAVPPTETEDRPELRRGLRTLMGLILKHRGGPGFGKGRIKGAEAEGFENLLGEITAVLRQEATSSGGAGASAEVKTAPAQPAAATPPPVQPQQVVAPPPPAQPAAVSTPPPPQHLQQVASPATYAPPATTMMESTAMTYSAPGLPDNRMSRTIACVEGAVQMYRNSPPEVQEGLMVPLRGALMSAVNTCNQIIAENELENVKSYQDAVTESPPAAQASTSAPTTPGQFFEVKPYSPGGGSAESSGEEETLSMASATMAPEPPQLASPPAVSAPTGTDENSVFLQTVYDSLDAASGNERLGLGKLSSAEADALADKVVEMKAMLIEELDTGIPEATVDNGEVSLGGGGTSKYQQMLAKAKAEKAAKQ